MNHKACVQEVQHTLSVALKRTAANALPVFRIDSFSAEMEHGPCPLIHHFLDISLDESIKVYGRITCVKSAGAAAFRRLWTIN